MRAPLHLPEGVYLQRLGDVYIFLDATSDRYVTLSKDQSRWFEEVRNMDATSSLSNIAEQFANRLVERGLLSQDAQQGKPLRESDVPATQSSVYDPVALDARGVSAREVAAILHAVASSWWLCHRHRSNVEAILRAV
ncbi:hypothetical protein AB6B38_14260 (plasmid) [Glycocaulis abyssi]|uniref:Uncharacterized protein n=1 Tax=Glycocaulis abyssi TaxID=1433403 RepID=A0ABV9NHR2_9PROT|nr:hypothetical protein FKB34_16255 [Glycocaulis profundi]